MLENTDKDRLQQWEANALPVQSAERLKALSAPTGWVSEAEQVEAFLRSRTPDARDTQNDYLCFGRAPDVLELIDGDLHSYEAKLRNWRQAVKQARDHQLVADYAWIVIPRPKPEWVDETGIGLIDGDSFEIVVNAQQTDPFRPAREKVISHYWPNTEVERCQPTDTTKH